jgi:dipeptidyl aminopeptidase/acylaminoacyl peptidase
MRPRSILAALLAPLVLAAGALAVTPAARSAEEAPLLPLGVFFSNPASSWDHRVSPDGTHLAWVAMRGGRATLHFRRLDETAARVIETPREARGPWSGGNAFFWARNGRQLLFLMDRNGDENTHLFAVDLTAADPAPRDLTPLDGVRVEFMRTLLNDPDVVLIRHNGRNGRLFDVYRLHVVTGEMTLETENPGDVLATGFSMTGSGNVRARFRSDADGGWFLEVPNRSGGWRELIRGGYGDYLRLVSYIPNSPHAWALSNRGRDRIALVRLNMQNASEDVVFEHPDVDVESVSIGRAGRLRYVWAWPGMKDTKFYDAQLQADLAPLLARERTALRILSIDIKERWLTLAVESDRGVRDIYLVDRETHTTTLLAQSPMQPYLDHMAQMDPVSFQARDGMTIHGLLTVPAGPPGPRPMVLLVHGGPWARDQWGYNPSVQFLTNRGYAVLQVNYRGSTQYGRSYIMAGTREFGRKMHDDLIDGVRWAVERGVADPARVAIMGASYGGYAALSGLAFTPDVFAAGIDRVGIADMVSLIENWPQYWGVGREFWSRFFGDPADPEDRRVLAERSPINRADAIRAPLLVVQGANDVRVKRDHSDRIVEALRARNHDVEYIVFSDEGHTINRTPNMLAYMRAVERFLARTIGGRDGGNPAD